MSQKITIYVDGACRGNPGLGGWGVYIQGEHGQFCYCGGELETTNNRMELTASIQALLCTQHDDIIEVWTDSNYVKQGISEWIINWKKNGWKNSKKQDVLNADLWKVLDELCQNRQISWHWVKGHAGHFGNEMADALANRGADEITNDKNKTKQVLCIETVDSPELVENSPLLPLLDNKSSIQEKSTDEKANDWLLNDPFGLDDNYHDETHNIINHELTQMTQVNIEQAEVSQKTKKRNKNKRSPLTSEEIQQHIIITPATKKLNGTRQLILDTETTGFYYQNDDRIIEVGAIEMVNRKLTGSSIHIYIQPEKEVGESVNVHGISDDFLKDKPIFNEVAQILYDYLKGAEIIAHNATFDMNFLDMEFEKAGFGQLSDVCSVVDTLAMAKAKHAGQRNSLDALVKRYDIPERDRTFHGALLDAEILADVYLAMTGGQVALDIPENDYNSHLSMNHLMEHAELNTQHLAVILPNADELAQHEQWYLQYYEKKKDITFFHALVDTALAEKIAQEKVEKAKLEAEEKARKEAEEKAKKEAEEQARKEAEEKAQQDLENLHLQHQPPIEAMI